ncbi:MAG: M20/M25/M40 family metallo-hydrolase [Bacteroides sp.]|nr:M20/M25/M40 family metallo-hydrolase [Bacteroides sp.]
MDAVEILKRMITIPSFSREEDTCADFVFDVLLQSGLSANRFKNNVWSFVGTYNPAKPTLMLNSHIDTVKPVNSYTLDPFEAIVENGKLYGLGSNDAGASVVAMIETCNSIKDTELSFNMLLAITAEEEVTGENGIRALLPHLSDSGICIDMALVGEPTGMQPAIGERGLVVLDCVNHGVAGHAARDEGINAIYEAISDIEKLRLFQFPKQSAQLGPIGIQTTMIQAGTQHNVVPAECSWVVDVRTTDAYSNEQTVDIIQSIVKADVKPRSTRIRASVISENHPMVRSAREMGKQPFVSATSSDMSQMSAFPSVKMGPGQSQRSHSANEFVLLSEIYDAVNDYTIYLKNLSNIILADETYQTLE